MKNKDKGGLKGRLLIRKIIRTTLIVTLSISCWELGKKQFAYKQNAITYKKIEQEKNNTDNIQEFLSTNGFDWIKITDTKIDYPLVQGSDNKYYTTHDYQGNDDIGGAIFYDAYDKPFNETITVIYGHSMRDGSMFNNLHYFQKDQDRFNNSKLLIHTESGLNVYRPLGYYVTDNDFFYKTFDELMTQDAIDIIKQKSDYFIDTKVKQGSHIIALFTCDYSKSKDGRLIVFYIEE